MGDSSTLVSSNIFKNQRLKKKKGFLPSVFFQAVILHFQTLEPSGNFFRRQELIWTQDKLICFQIVTQKRSSCLTKGSLWKNPYAKLVMELVIKLLIFDKIVLF